MPFKILAQVIVGAVAVMFLCPANATLDCKSQAAEAIAKARSAAGCDGPEPMASVSSCDSISENITAKFIEDCKEPDNIDDNRDAGTVASPDAPLPPSRPKGLGAATPAASTSTKSAAAQPQTPADKTSGSVTPTSSSRKSKASPSAAQSKTTTTPQDSNTAQNLASQDVNICSNSYSQANNCCTNPASCVSTSSSLTNSLNASSCSGATGCSQANQSLADASADQNKQYASACFAKETSCQSTCGDLATKYQQLVTNCDNCDSLSVYQNTVSTLNQKKQSCATLSDKASQIAAQSIGNSGAGDMSNAIAQQLASNPAAGINPNDPYGCQSNPSNAACQSCTNNPTSPVCKALAAAAANGDLPKAGFQTPPPPMKDSSFNVASPDGLPVQPQFGTYNPQQNNVTPIANNSGGGIPGSSDGSTTQATLGGAPSRRPSAGSPGYNVDVDQGFRSGGYSQPVSNNNAGDGPGLYPGGAKPVSRAPAGVGIDLKQYLPGHARDPNGRGGGLLNVQSAEIGGKYSDLWRKISNRYVEKCRLGELLDCR